MTERISCAACAHPDLDVFLDLGKTPLANKFPTAVELDDEERFPLRLGRCSSCGLVQMMEIIADDKIYGEDYGFYSGGSVAQRNYHHQGALLMIKRHLWRESDEDALVVEVACNDGSMLKHFHAEHGIRALGIDPAKPAQDAKDEGLPVIVEPFTYALGRQIRDEHGPAKLVIAYNSLAHVGDLPDVISGIRAMLDDEDGVAVVEVQYLPDLLAGNMYDQVYHEHRYYHSLSSFSRAAELHGLHVINAELIELQGGGIRFTLSPNANIRPNHRVEQIQWSERWINDPGTYASMQGRIDRIRDHLVQIVRQEIDSGRMVAGYAAAAKATTILNYCELGPTEIPFVIDTTPFKQGRFVPGTKIPILATGHADTLLLLAPNYVSNVVRDHPSKRVIMPTPSPYVI